ncbi:hypothetical protein MMC08_000581 [Hypocenomyce scalaris]|nr:hypothetical protein [Hypocenomyce scalaris]
MASPSSSSIAQHDISIGSKGEKNLEEMEYTGGVKIVPFDGLKEIYTVPGAREGGYLRYLKSWVGGPEGYVNPNLNLGAIVAEDSSVGYMKLMTGCRQKGVHSHGVVEIYIILKGEIEGYDGKGHTHHGGPMDCIYIPTGVPHAVRNSGREDLELLWIHDGLEKKSNITYYYTEAETPKLGGVEVIKFNNLEPHWGAPKARESPFLRYMISYVAGGDGYINFDPGRAYISQKCALGLLVIYPGNEQVPNSLPGNQCYVVVQGTAVVAGKNLNRLDALWVPAKTVHTIKNPGSELLWLFWTHEQPQRADSVIYES